MLTLAQFAQLFGVANASGTRAAGTLLFLGAASYLAPERFALAPDMGWLGSPLTLALLAGLLLLESMAERDPDVQQLMAWLQYAVRGAAGALAVLASAEVREIDLPAWALGLMGAGLALATQKVRLDLHRGLDLLEAEAVSPRRWLLRLEEGGVLAVLLAVLLAPVLALAAVVLGVVGAAVGAIVARRLEDRGRRPCPACGARIRKEACGCPRCGADVPVERILELNTAGIPGRFR